MKICKITVLFTFLCFLAFVSPVKAAINFTSTSVSATATLATATFTYNLTTGPSGDSGNYNVQVFPLNKDTGKYQGIYPPATYTIALLPNTSNTGSFSIVVPPGHYGGGKMSLFAAGTNYNGFSQDVAISDLCLTITTTQVKVTAPTLTISPPVVTAGSSQVYLAYTLKVPKGTEQNLWIQAKGTGGFAQAYVAATAFVPSGDPLDDYDEATGIFPVDIYQYTNAVPGVYNLQYGLYNGDFSKTLRYIYPGDNFEIGGSSWIVKANPANYPSLTNALAPVSAAFPGFIGGNEGNDLATLGDAPDATAAHFKILRARGLTVMRVTVDPDKLYSSLVSHTADTTYLDLVDQVVQNILMAGEVPELSLQDMPGGVDQADKEAKLQALDVAWAAKYNGVPILQCVLGEPHDYDWATWKPLATKIATAIRAANPNVPLIIDAEGYSTSLASAVASPPDMTLFKYVGYHAYVSAAALSAENFGGLPVLVEEYHDGGIDYHQALQQKKPAGILAWAWTFPGRDSLNLCVSLNGAEETYTPDGTAILNYYATWLAGGTVAATGVPVTGTGGGTVGVTTGGTGLTLIQVDTEIANYLAAHPVAAGLSKAEVDAEVDAKLAPILTRLTADENAIAQLQKNVNTLLARRH